MPGRAAMRLLSEERPELLGIATLLGRWFWWPQRVRPRPASQMLRPYGPRPAVRQLLLWDDEDTAVTSESPSHRR
jgi:putative drug exporter of the RND superfamily